jgi:hypothetical protein
MTSPKSFWQTTLALTFTANLGILSWSVARWNEIGVILHRSVWGLVLLAYLAVLAGCLFLFYWIGRPAAGKLFSALELPRLHSSAWRALGLGLFIGILLLIPWLKFTYRIGEEVKKSTQDPVLTMTLFYWACWWLFLLAAAALKVAFKTSWPGGFASALVILGLAYELYVRFQAVTSYPFSMGWSETSRYYYASLYFSNFLYGENFPLSTLHPTRYFLQSLAFIVPGLDLAGHRFWQFMLWLGMTAATALAVSRRVFPAQEKPGANGKYLLLAGWLFLFFLRVGIYYHLMPMILLPALFVSARHPQRSLAAVIVASLWAGLSRVNWFPVPAMLAIAIYLLETPIRQPAGGRKQKAAWPASLFAYLSQPLAWTIAGLLSALGAQFAYIPLSGNAENAGAFASSFTSDLLWDRLWPNELYGLGIFWGILIVSGPLLAVLLDAARQHAQKLHPMRWFGLAAMLAVLFTGSLVVSVKIGGGGDLHNMDAYAALVSVTALWFIGGQVAGESGAGPVQSRPAWPVTALAALIPILFLIPALSPRPADNAKWNQQNVEQLKTMVEGAPGPVLFINERHFVTFGIFDTPLVPEYENVSLMEMAMSGNQQVLGRFYADLASRRFALIVAGKQNLGIKLEGAFAEENNVWNTRVSPYILCYYEPVLLLEPGRGKIEVFAPRATPCR